MGTSLSDALSSMALPAVGVEEKFVINVIIDEASEFSVGLTLPLGEVCSPDDALTRTEMPWV